MKRVKSSFPVFKPLWRKLETNAGKGIWKLLQCWQIKYMNLFFDEVLVIAEEETLKLKAGCHSCKKLKGRSFRFRRFFQNNFSTSQSNPCVP